MMKKLRYFHVDAFADEPFKGNPAAVFLLEEKLGDKVMQNIAFEMNQSITVFGLIREGMGPLLRYFRPQSEVKLCGHGTLAFAHIYFSEIDTSTNTLSIDTKKGGSIFIEKVDDYLTMRLQAFPCSVVSLSDIPAYVIENLSPINPIYVLQSMDLILVYEDEKTVREMKPDFSALGPYKDHIIVTAQSSTCDFISRAIFAEKDKEEDPVTATAHCSLAPYWSSVLNKTRLTAYQASERGGFLDLDLQGENLYVTGKVVTIIEGIMSI